MKRLLVFFLITVILFTVTACKKEESAESNGSTHSSELPIATAPCDHNYSQATCTEPKTCSECGETEGEALEHTWSPADCTAPKTCSICDVTEGETLDHSWSSATCTAPKTCSQCGTTEGEPLSHNWNLATCAVPKTCSICSATEGGTLVHTWTSATCATPKTCSQCGATEGSALGHIWKNANCTTPKTCSKCGTTDGNAIGHNWKSATCAVPKTCATCGVTEGNVADHNWKSASCTAPSTCAICGKTIGNSLGHNYVKGECDRVSDGKICGDFSSSYCPKFYFTGDMSSMTSKKDVRNITFEYRSKEQTVNGSAKIKVQGTSSLGYEKKNYTIQFYENDEFSNKLGINVGWGSQNEYCLKANWIDKTHSRNVVTAKLVGEMQAKYGLLSSAPNNGAVDGFPVEVYINGSFHGLYTMNIPKAEWMFNMDKNNPNHIVICGENWNPAVLFKEIPTNFNDWAVEVGAENDATLGKIQRLFSFVINSSDAEFVADFDKYLNLDATLNYYVLADYAYMADNTGKNMLLATYDGKVWYPSLYDLDTSWGTNWQGTELMGYQNNLLGFSGNALWARVEQLFSKELAARYFELRGSILDEKHVMKSFNDFYNSIPDEVLAREKEKWNRNNAPIPGYDFDQIESYLKSVVPRLDNKYSNWK